MAIRHNFRLRFRQDNPGPVWLFLPGGPGLGSEYFDSLLEVVDLPGSICLVDFPGDGSNETSLYPNTWREGLIKLVQSIDRVHLVAHSFAAMFVMTIPELEDHLESLILMSANTQKIQHHEKDPVDLKDAFLSHLDRYVTPGSYDRAKVLFENLPYNADAFCWARDHFHPSYQPTWVPQNVPTLIFTGDKDVITPLSSFEGTPYAEKENILIQSIHDASHFPWLEKPGEVNRLLRLMREPVMTSERLLLRLFDSEDLDDVAEVLAGPQAMRYSLNGTMNRGQAKEYLNNSIIGHYQKWGMGLWGIYRKEDGVFLGMAGLLVHVIDRHQQVEIAYRLLPRYWGHGYATEASRSIRDWGFSHLDVTNLISLIEPTNKASIRVALRTGMHYHKNTLFHGIDVKVYRIKQVKLEPHNPKWKQQYLEEERKLKEELEGLSIQFFHIGSTSIAGICAKPIIDILAVVSDVFEVDAFNSRFEKLGFECWGEFGMKHRRFFLKYRQNTPKVHIHLFEDTDPEVGRHLRFCDYMNTHPEVRQHYEDLKKSLAAEHLNASQKYTLGKSEFITEMDRQAAHTGGYGVEWKNSPRRSKWNREQTLKAMEVNMHLHMTHWVKYVPSMEWFFDPDVTAIQAKVPDDTFNYVLSARFNADSAQVRVDEIISRYREKGLPFSWWVGEWDTPANLDEILQERGLTRDEENICMYLDLDTWSPEVDSPLVFERVTRAEQFRQVAEIFTALGGYSEIYEQLYYHIPPVLYDERAPFEVVVGFLEGKPVVSGILILHANVAGIYYVMTIPEQRKRGFGTAMMEHLLTKAKDTGYHLSTLQASRQGKLLYQRMGYKNLSRVFEYKDL